VTLLRQAATIVFAARLCAAVHPCEPCHAREVAEYSHTGMARSLRRPADEPAGSFSAGGARFTVLSDRRGTRQRLERAGQTTEFPVAYVIGSGIHAAGYLIRIGDHLFQSPICYYTDRRAYELAPGYERIAEPDFTRPVNDECLLCHSGRLPVQEAISCERCHGPTEQHLRRPVPGSIVNPAKLAAAARDSVCEQCHLAGVVRVLNPGREFADFHAGQRLEEVFTVYTRPARGNFKVISHAEQLALSACARNSEGRLWCGTCHDPHPPAALNYNARCGKCHAGKLSASHPAKEDCVGCHMTRRPAQDGGHTVFTDHRITRRPDPDEAAPPSDELTAWRAPEPALRERNLALAWVNAGIAARSPAQIVRGYRMLTEVQRAAPDDIGVLKGIGRALLLGKEPREALRAFERVLEFSPSSAAAEEDVGVALLESGQPQKAAAHLERALELDPLLLTAATALEEVYRRQSDPAKAAALRERMRRAIGGR
jgi:tetratricopeptide (TPR) repeat protein